ncbi:hypothetical protein [Streptomyces avermitilis]|uniref:hypothetical protein n=1 Tax=Streptomyces avermitilis TaxID=33903 RepID=UPI0038004631
MLNDPYGQNIPYPTMADVPNAQSAFEGVVKGLTPKSVMTFASANVRGATLTAPKAGMMTWLTDVGRLEVYDGTGWSTVTSGQSAWKSIALSTGYTNNGNSQGNFEYRLVNLFGETEIRFRGGLTVAYSGGTLVSTNQINNTALPVLARPTTLRTLVIPCSDVNSARITLKIDLTTNGYINLWGIQSGTNPPWIGFNGVMCSL